MAMQSAALLELAGSQIVGEPEHVKLQMLFGSLFKLELCLRQASADDSSHTGRALAPMHLLCLVRNTRSHAQHEYALVSVTCLLSQNCTFYVSSAHQIDEHTAVVRDGEGEGQPTLVKFGESTLSFSLIGDKRRFANAVRDAAADSVGLAPSGWLGHLLQVPLPPPEGLPDIDMPIALAGTEPMPEEYGSPRSAVAASLHLLGKPRRTGWETSTAESLDAATDITAAWIAGWHRAIVNDSGEDHILYSLRVRRGVELHKVLRHYTDFTHLHRTLVTVVHPDLVRLFAPLPRKQFFALNDAAKVERARELERYLRSLIIVLQCDTLAANGPESLVPKDGDGQHLLVQKHPSNMSSRDVAQLHTVTDGRTTCLHSGWLAYRTDDSEWAPRWITLIQQASLAPSPEDAAQGLCWVLVHAQDRSDEQPHAVVPLTSFVVKERTKSNKFSIIICNATSAEWVHKFRAPADAPDANNVILEWLEVIDRKVTPSCPHNLQEVKQLQQELHRSASLPAATAEQRDGLAAATRTSHVGWVEKERGRSSSFFQDRAWDRSWVVLHEESEQSSAGDDGHTDRQKHAVTSTGTVSCAGAPGRASHSPMHWLFFFHRDASGQHGKQAEPPVGTGQQLQLAVPLIPGLFTVAPPKKSRAGREHVLILRCHARHRANGWKHVLSFSSQSDLQEWQDALRSVQSQDALANAPSACGSPRSDLRSCSAASLESCCAKAGWLHWMNPVAQNPGSAVQSLSTGVGPRWTAQWTLLVAVDSVTWMVAFDSDSGDAMPTTFIRVAPETVVDVIAPPAGCMVNGRCIRLTGSCSPREPSQNAAASGNSATWQHTSTGSCYLLVADDEAVTSSWYESIQRIRTSAHRRMTERLIQTLRPPDTSKDPLCQSSAVCAPSAQSFDDTRKQGLAILLAFLDIVDIQTSSWHLPDERSSLALLSPSQQASDSSTDGGSTATMRSVFSSSQRRLRVGSTQSSTCMTKPGLTSTPSSRQMGRLSQRPRNRTVIQSYIQSRTDVLFSGFLWKQGGGVKSWKKRYFILRDDMLMYQKTEQGGAVSGTRGGVISLGQNGTWSAEPVIDEHKGRTQYGDEGALAVTRGVQSSGGSASTGGRQHCFAVFTLGRTLMLSAETVEQMEAWLSALNKLRSRTGEAALRRGVQTLFATGADAHAHTAGVGVHTDATSDVVAPLTSLLRILQYEVDSLCELNVLKDKMLEAMDAMQSATSAGDGDSSAGSTSVSKPTDLGEMEIDPDEVTMKELLAEGFFGKVYRGELHGLDVAIKKLKTDSLKTATRQEAAELIAELRAEVDVLTTLRHPNVVLIMGASTKNPANLFIVTEFLDCGNLYNVIHNPRLSDHQTLKMIEQVVLAINFLHGRTPKIIHRDIKPLNILVDSAHNIRVGDFGISCRDREKESRDQTQGTFAYMAPEVVTGQESASSASDVFSFGVVLYEWFFIRDRPGTDFQNDDDHCYENIHDAVHCGREPQLPPWWHPSIRETIRQCLACDAAARPTMSAVLSTIRELKAETTQTSSVGNQAGIAATTHALTPTTHRPDGYALRRFAVTELNNLMKLRAQPETTTAQSVRASIELLVTEYPDVLTILLGLSSHAGPEDLCYEAICSYLRVAEAYCYDYRTESERDRDPESAAADRLAVTEMQAAAVNVLVTMPLTDLCVPGKRWVPLDLDELHAAHHIDGTAHHIVNWLISKKKKKQQQQLPPPPMPRTPAESSRDDTSESMLMEEPTIFVPPRLLPVCGLLCSMDDDVRRWTEEMLASLPAEQIATPEDVRKELRRALVSGQFDLDEVTGTDLLQLLALRFEEDLIAECKQAKLIEGEMINVMSLLVSGPATQIVPGQIWLGGVFNATGRQLAELGITHVVCMAAEIMASEDGPTSLEYWRPREDLWDEPTADITPHILPALAFIDKARASSLPDQQQARVLVHCMEGVSRSASVVIALLMRDRKLSFDEALKFVQDKRPKASPNEGFEQQLRRLEPLLHESAVSRETSDLGGLTWEGDGEPKSCD